MKVIEITAANFRAERRLLNSMFRMRARIFSQRLGWHVTITNDMEKDEFDALDPAYLVMVDEEDDVLGSVRMLPGTGPTMLQMSFPQLLGGRPLAVHAAMVESSRFCVDTERLRMVSTKPTSQATQILLAAILNWCIANGYTELVTATDLRLERILRRAGWPMKRLGDPIAIDDTIAIAGSLPIHRDIFHRLVPADYPGISVARRDMLGTKDTIPPRPELHP